MVLLLGGRIRRIGIHMDTSGETEHLMPKGRFRRILTAGAGYPAPSITAAGLAFLVSMDWQRYTLYAMAGVAAVVTFLWVRNAWGVLVMLACGAAFGAAAHWGSETVQEALLWFLVGLLGFGGVRSAMEQFHQVRKRTTGGASDAEVVAKALFLPRVFVSGVFVIICLAAAAGAGWSVYRTLAPSLTASGTVSDQPAPQSNPAATDPFAPT